MIRRPALFSLLVTAPCALFAVPALAQHAGHQPYTGFEKREIKALSQQDIESLKAGRGMSLALSAELNSYPGPMHTLELADTLGLSSEQRERTESVMATMRKDAQGLGVELIEAERHLDQRFQHQHIDPVSLAEATARIGALQGRLRAVHLVAHLDMVTILTPAQIAAYDKARGYSTSGTGATAPAPGHVPGHIPGKH